MLLGSEVHLSTHPGYTWYSAARAAWERAASGARADWERAAAGDSYLRHLAGEGRWYRVDADWLVISHVTYELGGEYYLSDSAGNVVVYEVEVLDVPESNTVTVTALIGSSVTLLLS